MRAYRRWGRGQPANAYPGEAARRGRVPMGERTREDAIREQVWSELAVARVDKVIRDMRRTKGLTRSALERAAASFEE